MQDKLNAIIEKYCGTIKTSVRMIGRLLDEVAQGVPDPLATIKEAEALAHQLKGSSGTAGFNEISAAATALDDQLKILCRSNAADGPLAIDAASERFRSLEQLALAATPSSSSLYSGPS
ncbi:MAG: Hpt domain-containing protein [Rhodomicrobiaceae bacterium]